MGTLLCQRTFDITLLLRREAYFPGTSTYRRAYLLSVYSHTVYVVRQKSTGHTHTCRHIYVPCACDASINPSLVARNVPPLVLFACSALMGLSIRQKRGQCFLFFFSLSEMEGKRHTLRLLQLFSSQKNAVRGRLDV